MKCLPSFLFLRTLFAFLRPNGPFLRIRFAQASENLFHLSLRKSGVGDWGLPGLFRAKSLTENLRIAADLLLISESGLWDVSVALYSIVWHSRRGLDPSSTS